MSTGMDTVNSAARREVGAVATDRAFMREALALAERGWGRVHPNPLVGAVVVRDGEIVGVGYHAEYGGPHAEVAALMAAGERARGATIYVTLEPCSHHGKTPPCTEAILAAGIARVVFAAEDPHREARGGAERLREAGVEVVAGIERDAARAQNAIFFHQVERGSPFVALKYALTLDARLAEAPERPTAVTGPEVWTEVHRLRAGFDAIMVGSGTALADDPLLTVRGEVGPRVPPLRIILDTQARLPLDSRLLDSLAEAPILIACGESAPATRRGALEAAGARVLALPDGEGGVALGALFEHLAATGVRSIFCEGGGRLGATLLREDLVRRLYLFYAPLLFGESGVPAFPGGVRAPRGSWRRQRLEAFGEDHLLVLDRVSGETAGSDLLE
jgi:diaminohydroxyphosphoribosylaminopyrimidine deaminase/5-amino-6-(5-phosphoribosylamino)uracil reductase